MNDDGDGNGGGEGGGDSNARQRYAVHGIQHSNRHKTGCGGLWAQFLVQSFIVSPSASVAHLQNSNPFLMCFSWWFLSESTEQ